jgi:subfamily B ATP-binding cassette protein MsbA
MKKDRLNAHSLKLSLPGKPAGSAFAIYKRLISYGKDYWMTFVAAIIANLCYAGVDALFTYLLKPLLDKGFIDRDPEFLRYIPILLIFLFLFRAIANFLGNYFMAMVGRNIVMKFRQEIFKHFLKLPAKFYDHNSSGQLLSLLTYNTSQVSNACTEAVSNSVQSAFLVLGLLVVMFTISWQLTMIFLVTIPITATVVKLMSTRLRQLNAKIQNSMGHVTHVAEEVIESLKVVRMFGGENYEIEKFNQATKRNARQEIKVVVTKSFNVSLVQFIGVFALALMVMMATTLSSSHILSAGSFAAMIAAMLALLKPLKELTSVNSTIQRGLAAAESIFDLFAEPIENDTGTLALTRARGHIEFKNVCFSYGSRDDTEPRYVLKNINFTINPGETVALVGHSGGGKSTLAHLIPRFYDVTDGEILLDGTSLSQYRLKDLRQQFALVSQQVTLFNDTVLHNVAYGSNVDTLDQDAILSAAKAAHAYEFIEQLPQGFETLIGENGVLLSGGQRQRIAIARAILKNAPILILDEATSALDTESERLIQAALDHLMRHCTTLVIAHRLSTIEKANKIIVLDHGQIVEMGTHRELLAMSAHYAKLHNMQFKTNYEHQD